MKGKFKVLKLSSNLKRKGLLEIERSKGGRIDSHKKFNKFSLANEFIFLVVNNWIEIKEEHGFYINDV